MSRDTSPQNQRVNTFTNKQSRNRHSSAGITGREADTLTRCAMKIFQISQKKNLYIGYERELLEINDKIYRLLEKAGR